MSGDKETMNKYLSKIYEIATEDKWRKYQKGNRE
jgi:hypothetical protein